MGVSFISGENENDYAVSFQHMQAIFGKYFNPSVVVNDRDLALVNTLRVFLPCSKLILCRWHVNKNIVKNWKDYFGNSDSWDMFLAGCNELWCASTEDSFNESLKLFCETWKEFPKALEYILNT
jgi:hypothetical protein